METLVGTTTARSAIRRHSTYVVSGWRARTSPWF
jgi:hypothetical protein